MVYEHGGLALNLFKLKAIKMEKDKHGGYLVFEFHNFVREIEVKKGSGIWEDRSYENSPVSQYFDNWADLELHYHEWTGLWFERTGYIQRGDEALWRKQNGFEDGWWDEAQEEERKKRKNKE